MKKGIKRMLSAIACAALAMGCLAGCGSNASSSTTGTTTEAATENASTAASEASGAVSYTHLDVYKRQILDYNYPLTSSALLHP